MFISEDPTSHEFSGALIRYLAPIQSLALKYFDEKFKLNLSPSTEYLPIDHVSWLLAISTLYKSHAKIHWESKELYHQAININVTLIDEIFKNIYHPIKREVCGENHITCIFSFEIKINPPCPRFYLFIHKGGKYIKLSETMSMNHTNQSLCRSNLLFSFYLSIFI